ncbi:MAG: PIN domain-containing protein [Pseudomonadota bacterium]
MKLRGELLPDADIFIAAIARAHGLILVTNDSHFDRIEGLRIENWLKED